MSADSLISSRSVSAAEYPFYPRDIVGFLISVIVHNNKTFKERIKLLYRETFYKLQQVCGF
jgi:hypothetical protein